MSDDKIISEIKGSTGHIIFNNPKKMNAVSLEMWQEATRVIEEMAIDPQVRVLVISGAGKKAFISGADISKFESERATQEGVELYNRTSEKFRATLIGFPKPVIAKISGYCIGGGVNVAAGCDIRICDERSSFGVPAAKLGLGYGYTGVKRVASLVGIANTMEIFFTARQFTAAEAYDMGLVNRVVPSAMLDAYVDDYTRRISENAPLTMAAIKASAQEIFKSPDTPDLELIDKMVQSCFDSEDYIEGRRAFMEKRKPEFKGQ